MSNFLSIILFKGKNKISRSSIFIGANDGLPFLTLATELKFLTTGMVCNCPSTDPVIAQPAYRYLFDSLWMEDILQM